MRFEILLIIITGLIIANIYTEGKMVKLLYSWKKYYQMAGVLFGAFAIYWLIKKNPAQAGQILSASNDYVKYLHNIKKIRLTKSVGIGFISLIEDRKIKKPVCHYNRRAFE